MASCSETNGPPAMATVACAYRSPACPYSVGEPNSACPGRLPGNAGTPSRTGSSLLHVSRGAPPPRWRRPPADPHRNRQPPPTAAGPAGSPTTAQQPASPEPALGCPGTRSAPGPRPLAARSPRTMPAPGVLCDRRGPRVRTLAPQRQRSSRLLRPAGHRDASHSGVADRGERGPSAPESLPLPRTIRQTGPRLLRTPVRPRGAGACGSNCPPAFGRLRGSTTPRSR